MRRIRWEISPVALVLFALAYFFDASGIVSAVIPAVAAHELGHLLALRLCRRHVSRVRLDLRGAELDYTPRLEGAQAFLCLAAGPLAGGLYALAACSAGGAFWPVSGAASFVLTVFNLLPVLPLDGGRMLAAAVPQRAVRILSLMLAAALLTAGGWLALSQRAFAPLLPGLWLTLCNATCFFRSSGLE